MCVPVALVSSGRQPCAAAPQRGPPGTDEDRGRVALRPAPASAGPGALPSGWRRACCLATRIVLALLGAASPLVGRPAPLPRASVVGLHTPRSAPSHLWAAAPRAPGAKHAAVAYRGAKRGGSAVQAHIWGWKGCAAQPQFALAQHPRTPSVSALQLLCCTSQSRN